MLSEGDVIATLAVRDIEQGKAFYGDKLGLQQSMENAGGVGYKVGAGQLFENRDVAVTTDFRDVFGELLTKQLGVGALKTVFPNYDVKARGIMA